MQYIPVMDIQHEEALNRFSQETPSTDDNWLDVQ
jgi:hypothetical protein